MTTELAKRPRTLLWRQHLLAASIVVLGLINSGWAQDRIFLKQGNPLQGSIGTITPTQVTIEVRGKEQNVPVADIRKITFDKEPSGLDRARDLALDGKYSQALDQLRNVPREGLADQPLVRQDYEFYYWYSDGMRSLAGSGDSTAAIRGLVNLDKSNPDSHHRFQIKLLLGRLALAKKVYDRSEEYFSELVQSPSAQDKAAGLYYLARLKLEQERPSEAREHLKSLLSAPAGSPEMARTKSRGAILEARIDILEGSPQQALEALDGMAEREDNADYQLFAEICNARGAAHLKMDDPHRAAISFLQTDLLFFTDPETHAEALYHLKQLLVTVGQPARAADAGSRLANLYASSKWANQ
jgi:tetratricopeptide (TPR) repeat protein